MRSSFLSWSSPAVRYLTGGVTIGSVLLLVLLRSPPIGAPLPTPSSPGAGAPGLPGSVPGGSIPCLDAATLAAPIGDLAGRSALAPDAGVDPLVRSLLADAAPGPIDDRAVTEVVRDLEAAASRCEVPP